MCGRRQRGPPAIPTTSGGSARSRAAMSNPSAEGSRTTGVFEQCAETIAVRVADVGQPRDQRPYRPAEGLDLAARPRRQAEPQREPQDPAAMRRLVAGQFQPACQHRPERGESFGGRLTGIPLVPFRKAPRDLGVPAAARQRVELGVRPGGRRSMTGRRRDAVSRHPVRRFRGRTRTEGEPAPATSESTVASAGDPWSARAPTARADSAPSSPVSNRARVRSSSARSAAATTVAA